MAVQTASERPSRRRQDEAQDDLDAPGIRPGRARGLGRFGRGGLLPHRVLLRKRLRGLSVREVSWTQARAPRSNGRCAAWPTVAAAALVFRGRASGRAVWTGLCAGSGAMLLPLGLATAGCRMFGDACMRFCLPACVAGGLAMGFALATVARRQEQGEGEFLAGGAAVAALTASLGCTLAGAGGILAMVLGTVLAGAPVWLAARAQR